MLCRNLIKGQSFQGSLRHFTKVISSSSIGSEDIPEDLLPFTEGRGRQERRDSLTLNILQERKIQSERIKAFTVDELLKNELEDDGFGQKKRLQGYYEAVSEIYEDYTTGTAAGEQTSPFLLLTKLMIRAGGHSTFLGSFNMELPEFDHLLPEIAMLGHSNTGKVTFLYYHLCDRLLVVLSALVYISECADRCSTSNWPSRCF